MNVVVQYYDFYQRRLNCELLDLVNRTVVPMFFVA